MPASSLRNRCASAKAPTARERQNKADRQGQNKETPALLALVTDEKITLILIYKPFVNPSL
jgi:hypothetical protein